MVVCLSFDCVSLEKVEKCCVKLIFLVCASFFQNKNTSLLTHQTVVYENK